MPKQLYKITEFHGGLNSNSDARDIADDQLSEATDVMVDELGKIRLMGGEATHGTIQAQNDSEINPGYGLFQFSHDRRDGHTAGAGTEVETDYMAFSDPDTQGTVDIYSNEDDTWGSPITGMTNNSSGLRADVFYAADGALRVCDSDFGNSNSNKWYGYVNRTHFNGLTPGGSADTYDTWHLASAEIAAPTRGIHGVMALGSIDGTDANTLTESSFFKAEWDSEIVGHSAMNTTEHLNVAVTAYTSTNSVETGNVSDWTGDTVWFFPPAGTGFNFHTFTAAGTGSTGSIPAGSYEFATTFIYDAEPGELGAQESLPYLTKGADFVISAGNTIQPWVTAQSPYDPRITGGRLYARISSSDSVWIQIGQISLKHGVKAADSDDYTAWTIVDSDNNNTSVGLSGQALGSSKKLSPVTYEINTGISQNSPSLAAKYKTAVVANRVAYIGNVQYNGVTYGDSILQSPVNKFDIFTKDKELAASISDGDSIVKLEEYADRLLQFKKKKMQLINISQYGSEFLEDTFMHKGVSSPGAVCKTDFGIAWVNKQGCYLYDGQRVSNLLEKGGMQTIKESDWATFTTNEPMIGYVPKKRQLIVVDDNTTTGTGKTFLYDLVTQSWVKGAAATITSQALTNFVTDWNGDLVYAHTSDTGTFVKWDDASDTSTAVDIKTKDIDFGQPGQTKRIYKFYVTHRGSASNIQLSYATNGDQDTFTPAGSALPTSSAVTDWVTTAITPTTFSCTSLRLRLFSNGTTPANFEINDITIVFRSKGMR